MNAKEARDLLKDFEERGIATSHGDAREAIGFLDCYEQIEPLLNAVALRQRAYLETDILKAKALLDYAHDKEIDALEHWGKAQGLEWK